MLKLIPLAPGGTFKFNTVEKQEFQESILGSTVISEGVEVCPNSKTLYVRHEYASKHKFDFDFIFNELKTPRRRDVDSNGEVETNNDLYINEVIKPALIDAMYGKDMVLFCFSPTYKNEDSAIYSMNYQNPIKNYNQGVLFKILKFLCESRESRGMDFEIEMGAFQFQNNKIIDIGMPSDAKLATSTEVRNCDFDEFNMKTYNTNGIVYIKNSYRKIDIQKPEEIKYFVDKWIATQTFKHEISSKSKLKKNEKHKSIHNDELHPSSRVSPTLFKINLISNIRTTRIYVVAFPPYIPDFNCLPKELENLVGIESTNFCINKTIDLVIRLKESQLMNFDFEEFYQILKFTNILKNVLRLESNILFFGQIFANEKPLSLINSNGYLNITHQYNHISDDLQFAESMKEIKYNTDLETVNDQQSDTSELSEVKTIKLNSKIDAFKRAERAKLEDIRNLLGLNLTSNIDFECILSK